MCPFMFQFLPFSFFIFLEYLFEEKNLEHFATISSSCYPLFSFNIYSENDSLPLAIQPANEPRFGPSEPNRDSWVWMLALSRSLVLEETWCFLSRNYWGIKRSGRGFIIIYFRKKFNHAKGMVIMFLSGK